MRSQSLRTAPPGLCARCAHTMSMRFVSSGMLVRLTGLQLWSHVDSGAVGYHRADFETDVQKGTPGSLYSPDTPILVLWWGRSSTRCYLLCRPSTFTLEAICKSQSGRASMFTPVVKNRSRQLPHPTGGTLSLLMVLSKQGAVVML